MRPLSNKKRNIIFVIFLAVFAILFPIILLYSTGYRLSEHFSIVRTGGIYIHPWGIRGTISIDGKEVGETSLIGKDYLIQSLKPNHYTVSFNHDGYIPWQKTVTVRRQLVTEINPFIIPKEFETVEIPKLIPGKTPSDKKISNPIFKTVSSLFIPEIKPSILDTSIENDIVKIASEKNGGTDYQKFRKMAIWKKDNTIVAKWTGEQEYTPPYFCNLIACQETITIFSDTKNIGDFMFYPDRNDIMIIALEDGIYAVEFDTRDVQNKMPISLGKNLSFRLDGYTLYIQKDSSTFEKIILE